jgi:hypothetical protein
MTKHTIYTRLVAASLLVTSQLATSATLRLEFTGILDECNECSGSALEPLLGTTVNGVIEFSTNLTDTLPEPSVASYLVYPSNGHYRVDTVVQAFDLNGATPFRINVADNEPVHVDISEDIIRFYAIVGDYWYELMLVEHKTDGITPSWLVNDELPSIDVWNSASFAGFSLWEEIGLTSVYSSLRSPLQYSVSVVPVPAGLPLFAASVLPLLTLLNRSKPSKIAT